MFEIRKYTQENKNAWDVFVRNSINATFLFFRDYMDYHSYRFHDFSLMIYRKGSLFALLPANIDGDILYSHQGLTYGGLLIDRKATTAEIVDLWSLMNEYLKSNGVSCVIYKSIPFIFQNIPAQEDLYALFRTTNAQLIGRNMSATIYQDNKIKFIESRKSGIRKAIANDIQVRLSDDWKGFWDILDENLKNKYGAAPVHTLGEMLILKEKFPKNIKLYMAYRGEKPVGGSVLYITQRVVHTQYISANLEGKEMGALDLLFDYLINQEYCSYPIFDFGTSNEEMGRVLNEPLIFQKEGFGGRGVACDIYKYTL